MDKVINGVDVSGCEFLRNCIIPDNYGCKIDDSLCCDVGNCYYKQLQRAKAENFELKESLKCFQTPEAIKALTFYKTGEFELQEKKCIKLEQENERLKEENYGLNQELLGYKKGVQASEIVELKQTLLEIREIVETEPPFKYCSCCEEIKEKINEVIGAE